LLQPENPTDGQLDKELPIEFKNTKFKYNFFPGSASSVQFHQSLQKSSSEDIYRCEIVRVILAFKWQSVRMFAYFQCLIYVLYLASLFVHCLFLEDTDWIIILLLAFGFYFLVFECIQIALNPRAYLTDFWNMLDLARVLFTIVYAFCRLEEYGDSNSLLTALNLFSWFRAFSFLRLF